MASQNRQKKGNHRSISAKSKPSIKNRFIASILIALCLLIIGYSARAFRADLLHWEAHYIQTSWIERREYPTEEELAKSQELYQKALEWQPNYPAYHDALAYLFRLEMLITSDPTEYERLGRESIANNKAALKNRPIWPSSYSQIVLVKGLLGEFDDEWHEYYLKAFELGPWGEVNLVQIAEAGIMYWPWLEEGKQNIAFTSLLRAIEFDRSHAAYLRATMDTHARTAVICQRIEITEARLPQSDRAIPRNLCN